MDVTGKLVSKRRGVPLHGPVNIPPDMSEFERLAIEEAADQGDKIGDKLIEDLDTLDPNAPEEEREAMLMEIIHKYSRPDISQ
jgi:hypothetical protein